MLFVVQLFFIRKSMKLLLIDNSQLPLVLAKLGVARPLRNAKVGLHPTILAMDTGRLHTSLVSLCMRITVSRECFVVHDYVFIV